MSSQLRSVVRQSTAKNPLAPDAAEPLPQLRELSPQERRIVALISQEYQTKEVARELGISGETVKTHLRRVYAKLGVHSRAGLVARAYARFEE